MKTNTEILIVGGGLSGLAAAWQLSRANMDVILVDSRDRIGGRVLTSDGCDLGPSWIWPGQPLVASALDRLDIPFFEQHGQGQSVYQDATGRVQVIDEPSSMSGSLRISGGVGKLATEMRNQIESSRIRLRHSVDAILKQGDSIHIHCQTPKGPQIFEAQKIAIAIPPRLAAEIDYSPALPLPTIQKLQATPTWMAGHAKFFAVYDSPFWRNNGLCGTAVSRKGPMAEIHDATPSAENQFVLFEFVGLNPAKRASMGEARITEQTIQQFVELFGDKAGSPKSTHYQDWSLEEFTAAASDRVPQTRHPQYGLQLDVGADWQGKLSFTASETSFVNGGLIEGALEAAQAFVRECTKSPNAEGSDSTPHAASMGWDWF